MPALTFISREFSKTTCRRLERQYICHVDISLGPTKIEARAKMSSDSVSISSVMPTPRVCSVTLRLHDNKDMTFVSLYRLSRPQTLPTFFETVHFSFMFHFDSEKSQFEE